MTEKQKIALMWLVAALAFFLGVFACLSRNPPGFEWQGAGAAALIVKQACLKQSANFIRAKSAPVPLPSLVTPAINIDTYRPKFYFVATATDTGGLESDYSNEVMYMQTGALQTVTMAWDASPGTNVISNYRVYWGGASAIYTNSTNAGTALTVTARVNPPPPTNLVVRVTSTAATNLQWSARAGASWTKLGTTNYMATNPPSMRLWRAMGRTTNPRPRVYVTSWKQ